jgi:hypothetical protein
MMPPKPQTLENSLRVPLANLEVYSSPSSAPSNGQGSQAQQFVADVMLLLQGRQPLEDRPEEPNAERYAQQDEAQQASS